MLNRERHLVHLIPKKMLVDAIRENIVEYTAMDEQARLAWVRNYMEAA